LPRGWSQALATWSATSLFSAISRRANGIASTVTGGISTAAKFAVLKSKIMQQLKGFFQSQPDDDSPFTTAARPGRAETIPNDGEADGSATVYLPIKSENSLVLVMGMLGMGLLVSLFANVFIAASITAPWPNGRASMCSSPMAPPAKPLSLM
jgi:hypothetical protein